MAIEAQLTTLPSTPAPLSAEEAFTSVQEEAEAIPPEEVEQINVDLQTACSIILGAVVRLMTLRAQMLLLLGFPIDALDRLRTYALAALYANAVATQETGENTVAKLLVVGEPLRENLLVAAQALAHRGLVSPQRVTEIKAGRGHLDTASDLIALAALLGEAWPAIEGKTTVTREELDLAAVTGSELIVALSVRSVGGARVTPKSQLARERTFTLLVRAWDECRRAATYLRWHQGDVDDFAPSIYAKRKRKAVRSEEPEAPTAEPTPVATDDGSPVMG